MEDELISVSNSNCSEGQMRSFKVTQGCIMTTRGPHYDANATMAVSLIRSSFYISFLAKGTVTYGQIISTRTRVCFSKCTSQGVQKFWHTILCKYIKRKFKYNKWVIRTDNCLITSHSTILTVVIISPTQFYVWQKTGRGKRSFCPSKRKTGYGCSDTT